MNEDRKTSIKKFDPRIVAALGIIVFACSASGALSVDEQVKRLAQPYNQIEAQLLKIVTAPSVA